jgi:hypothetical protein
MPSYCHCGKRAYYGIKKNGVCYEHKTEGMPHLDSPCTEKECSKKASYNYLGVRKNPYCGKHKKENMYLIYKLCRHPGCLIISSYGIKSRIYCNLHKKEGMKYLIKR